VKTATTNESRGRPRTASGRARPAEPTQQRTTAAIWRGGCGRHPAGPLRV